MLNSPEKQNHGIVAKNVQKMSENCSKPMWTQVLTFFGDMFAYLVIASIWQPCPTHARYNDIWSLRWQSQKAFGNILTTPTTNSFAKLLYLVHFDRWSLIASDNYRIFDRKSTIAGMFAEPITWKLYFHHSTIAIAEFQVGLSQSYRLFEGHPKRTKRSRDKTGRDSDRNCIRIFRSRDKAH